MSEFQVGDRVRVNNPALSTHNDEGVVAAYWDGSGFPYHVQLAAASAGYLAAFAASELEHVRQFKVGDLVRVRDDSGFLPGRIGVVEYNGPYAYRVRLVDSVAFDFTEAELEPRGFHVGDRVRVRPFDGDDQFLRERAGREGVVALILDEATAPKGWTVKVRLDGAEWTDIFAPTELEFIEEGEPETPPRGCGLCWEDTDDEDSENVQSDQLTFQGYLAEFGVERVDPVRSEALKLAVDLRGVGTRTDAVVEVAKAFERYLRTGE